MVIQVISSEGYGKLTS